MSLRVIGGRAKGRRLKRVPGDTTRPMMARAKESLFNILGETVVGSRWLDLFAGTGQVGIEALSRGAAEVVFVDHVRAAVQTVRDNLNHTQLVEEAEVILADAFHYLSRPDLRRFDVVYVAPPQYKDIWRKVLEILDADVERYLSDDGIVVVQIDPREYLALPLKRLKLVDNRRYGNTQLLFYAV